MENTGFATLFPKSHFTATNLMIANIPGLSLYNKSLRLRRFRSTMIRKATASNTRMTTFTERHNEQMGDDLGSTICITEETAGDNTKC